MGRIKCYPIFFLSLVSLLMLCGCRQALYLSGNAWKIERDAQLTCDETVANRCAIDSQFQTLADEAIASADFLHYACLLDVGEDELLARIHMIRAARESVVLQTFIYDDDEVGQLLFMELLAAARRGVKVRMVLDQIMMTPQWLAIMATAHENLDIKVYKPVMSRAGRSVSGDLYTAILDMDTLNERMHNKLFAVDGRIGIVGGRNIQDSYYDYDDDFIFKDLGILVAGPVVERMYESFDMFWRHRKSIPALKLNDINEIARGNSTALRAAALEAEWIPKLAWIDEAADRYSIADHRPGLEFNPIHNIEYISDMPLRKRLSPKADQWESTKRIRAVSLLAQESILIQTPYLLQDTRGIKRSQNFNRDNPHIDIALSTNSLASTDKFYVYAISFKQRQRFLKDLDCRLYEFKPVPGDVLSMVPRYPQVQSEFPQQEPDPYEESELVIPLDSGEKPRLCVHSKFFVIDDHITFIGSHNFDPRGNNLNTENGVLIWDDALALRVRQIFERDTAPQNSWVVAWRPKMPVVGHVSDSIAAISAALPFFDVWPFYYSSNYELIEGKEPVPVSHPDFYDHYEAVGPFPMMGLTPDQLGVRFIRAFGGSFARGLM